jgi:hypothetical protein
LSNDILTLFPPKTSLCLYFVFILSAPFAGEEIVSRACHPMHGDRVRRSASDIFRHLQADEKGISAVTAASPFLPFGDAQGQGGSDLWPGFLRPD